MILRKDVTAERVKRLYDQNMSAMAVANALNCSEALVKSRLESIGYKLRTRAQAQRVRQASREKNINAKTARRCTCCGRRFDSSKPVRGVLLTRLCPTCWETPDPEPIAFYEALVPGHAW